MSIAAMTTTTAPVVALTKEDVAALRAADEWIFSHNADGLSGVGSDAFGYHLVGQIRAVRGGILTPYDERVVTAIPVLSHMASFDHDHARVYDYGFSMHPPLAIQATIAAALRVGDSIMLDWLAGNNNDYLKRHGLYHDQLMLAIDRPTARLNKWGVRVRPTFLVNSSIAEDNIARMCRSGKRAGTW